ncbi:MAG: PQQ-binding-like beta-propeller repeat protein [Planctomycetes bacterium]|nr:PQQ-binding-like beta-propeller repeat protein [Planctomycetota bacterium]
MRSRSAFNPWVQAFLALVFWVGVVQAQGDDPAALARQILDQSGVQGGIVVHLGCGSGQLTAALRAGDCYTVQGLETDPAQVARARTYLKDKGLYGPVCVEAFSGATLPYTDNLINLVVVQDPGKVPMAEVTRVLVPGGVVCVARDGTWSVTRKPWPDNIDQWGHFLHDASNNAVARDAVVGPPRHLQWVAPPLWLRTHETPSGIQACVSAGGRLFYLFDEGLIGIADERLPDRWSLICRDAFNGKQLWRRAIQPWGWRQWGLERFQGKDWTVLSGARTNVPNENQRRVVADGDRLYATLGYQAPMSILNAATGATLTTVEATRNTQEILVSDGVVVVWAAREKPEAEAAVLVAVDGRQGEVLWEKPVGRLRALSWAIQNGRVIYLGARQLAALDLKTGDSVWSVRPEVNAPRTLVVAEDVVVMQDARSVAAHDAKDGRLLWSKTVPPIGGGEGEDLFVVDHLVWRGILCVNEEGQPVNKSANALALGWDLRTGEEKKRILVKNLRSPEHHHRCYRNKATTHYLISSYEGAEFLDFQGDNHGQNNWVRGACKYGMMPCNGLLYAPPDQCFCEPGGKLLGYAALKAGPGVALEIVPDDKRLEKGPAYGEISVGEPGDGDWPTYRHDAARSGATRAAVTAQVQVGWTASLGGPLTTPVAAAGRVFVARSDIHTLYALEASSGKQLWEFTTGGRIDSPPTIHKGLVLLGSKDGRVYCLRSSDGQLVWRFLAAPADRCVGGFDQIESAWPVHGSVLVDNDTAYCTAGRSTYLDGGIRVWALEPATGRILHQTVLAGPHHNTAAGARDLAFFVPGANSDVLVSEGGFLYMRQKKLTRDLKEIKPEVLSPKGEADVGLHVFSTAGLLDASWYNRTFWMYSKRWPGFQLANQAPKSGQLLVTDDEKTYAVSVFYRRNVHSPMFFPAKEGYLLFADLNTNEPQIVGEPGARRPLPWLPQSDYERGGGRGIWKLEQEAFGLDKMIGYTRAEPPVWMDWLPVRIRAMVKAGDALFVAGAPDVLDPQDPYAAFEGRKGARLVAVSAQDGQKLSEASLDSPPVFDGLIAAGGRLFASLEDGRLVCLAGK